MQIILYMIQPIGSEELLEKLCIPKTSLYCSSRYNDNLLKLIKLTKIVDYKYWLRGEKFGSVIFISLCFSLAYLFVEVVIFKVNIYDIAK